MGKGPPIHEERLEMLREGSQQRLRQLIADIIENSLDLIDDHRNRLWSAQVAERLDWLLQGLQLDDVQSKPQWSKLVDIAQQLRQREKDLLALPDAAQSRHINFCSESHRYQFQYEGHFFQTTVEAAGSQENAKRLAGKCLRKFQLGLSKADVTLFRNHQYRQMKRRKLA